MSLKAAVSILSAFSLAPLLPPSAFAQGSIRYYDAGDFFVESVGVFCGEIDTTVRADAADLIQADYYTVVINGPAYDPLPPGVRLFAYYQTCGLILYRDPTRADALAVHTGMGQGWLSASDVEAMCLTDLLFESGWSEAPDETRCDAIQQTMRELVLGR